MAQAQNQALVDRFEQFYRNYYREEIGDLAQHYPSEQRSLDVDWQDLYRFDPDLADDYIAQPDQLREYAEEALRVYDLPVDVKLGGAHIRVRNLPEITEIRAIRSRDVNTLVSVRGIVRKATGVRPKIEEAAFECQRCGTLTYIPQTTGFQEPHQCQGCERQGPFSINYDQSTFVDAQKLRIQESPEGLRGGETPESIDVNIEDDITGLVTPGDHVTITGALRIEQQGSGNEKSRMFDVFMDGHSIVVEDQEFESMDITDADKQAIIELSQSGDIYGQMVDSIAPTIYGYDQIKLAIALQLFSGITKHLPDASRIRGDFHILLIGDPGTGKCTAPNTSVTLADGSDVRIGELVEDRLTDPIPVDDGVYQAVNIEVPSVAPDGSIEHRTATKVWKREAPDRMVRIRTASGRALEVTPTHPLFVQSHGHIVPKAATDLTPGQFVAVPRTSPPKSEATPGVDSRDSPDIIPEIGDELRRIRERLALPLSAYEIPPGLSRQFEQGERYPTRRHLRVIVDAFEERLRWLSDTRHHVENGDVEDLAAFRRVLNDVPPHDGDAAVSLPPARGASDFGGVAPDGGRLPNATRPLLGRIEAALEVADDVAALRALADSDIAWDRIESIEAVDPSYDWVYDLEVDGTHNYLTNSVVSHNSQLLQYIRHIAPRSVYTSGKGSSSAGLTAAAIRDDFSDGQQWTLEAGALVLADKGTAAVDELDKMRPEDRSAMHQALEQQEISISKAGINATLKSRCSLLGAANPKYGRFDQYEPIAEQIELDPALISRFDLIFTVTDQPDEEEDRRLADHILTTNFAGELNTHYEELRTSNTDRDEVEALSAEVEPAIDPDLFRKYIAYAKRNCFPTMTEEAREAIREFYVDLRSRGAAEDAPVPVTARKLEAIIRLAEASARVRLSDTVDRADAERVIEIVRSCLRNIGVDPETGQFDADIIETGTSKSQRDRIRNLKALIAEIEDDYEDGAPIAEVMDRAEEVGIDEAKAEHEIEKLRQRGEVYEPAQGHLRTT